MFVTYPAFNKIKKPKFYFKNIFLLLVKTKHTLCRSLSYFGTKLKPLASNFYKTNSIEFLKSNLQIFLLIFKVF